MQHLLVERLITVVGYLGVGAALGGMHLNHEVIWLGLVAGIALIVARIGLLQALRTGQASVTFTFWNMSLVIPVLLSIFLWRETPASWQIVGLVLTPICLLLLSERSGQEQTLTTLISIWPRTYPIVLCVAGEGIFATCFKIMDAADLGESRNLFLVIFNLVALAVAVIMCCAKQEARPHKMECAYGAVSGLGFIIAGTFGVMAVLRVPGTVFFPVISAGTLVLNQ